MELDLITRTEQAIIDRLKTGLGKMVTSVESYAGELDDELAEVVRRFPAAWVTFGGVSKTEPISANRKTHKATVKYVVMVGQINRRGGSAARMGTAGEIGINQLQYAVRRLLGGQDFGLPIANLQPGAIRTIHNSKIAGQAFQVCALEFSTAWNETLLENGKWPTPGGADDPDQLFAKYGSRTDQAVPDLLGIESIISNPGTEAQVRAVTEFEEQA